MCVHKSLLNGFPRSDLVRGNVTHRICCPAWLSLGWPHLTPPAGIITDPHLSHFLSDIPTPLYFNDRRFTRWLEKPGAAKKYSNTTQCGRDKQKKARAAQKAPTALRCILSHSLICSSFHVITRHLARTQPEQRGERSRREKRREGARKRSRWRHSAAGDRVGLAGQEEERTEEKTWWLSLSSEVNTQLYCKVPELVDLKIQYNHSLLRY